MPAHREIRADFDRETIVMYQAYGDEIADAALAAGAFVPPFSLRRMTWIKPSFLWLMERSAWASRRGQTRILAVRMTRAGLREALAAAVLTEFEPSIHGSREGWREAFDRADVHVQWDPERSLRGVKLPHRSIQIGLGRAVIESYTRAWVVKLEDVTARARKIRRLRDAGQHARARRLLPPERVYSLDDALARRLGM